MLGTAPSTSPWGTGKLTANYKPQIGLPDLQNDICSFWLLLKGRVWVYCQSCPSPIPFFFFFFSLNFWMWEMTTPPPALGTRSQVESQQEGEDNHLPFRGRQAATASHRIAAVQGACRWKVGGCWSWQLLKIDLLPKTCGCLPLVSAKFLEDAFFCPSALW